MKEFEDDITYCNMLGCLIISIGIRFSRIALSIGLLINTICLIAEIIILCKTYKVRRHQIIDTIFLLSFIVANSYQIPYTIINYY